MTFHVYLNKTDQGLFWLRQGDRSMGPDITISPQQAQNHEQAVALSRRMLEAVNTAAADGDSSVLTLLHDEIDGKTYTIGGQTMANEEKNPFEGLSDENALRMYVHLTWSQKMTSSEIYAKYGYMVPAAKRLGINDTLTLVTDIAQRGVILESPNANNTSKQTSAGCIVPIMVSLVTGLMALCVVAYSQSS